MKMERGRGMRVAETDFGLHRAGGVGRPSVSARIRRIRQRIAAQRRKQHKTEKAP